ncbi:MAG: Rid family detoxifying hydrolase [Ichthyobacteriaceae bacterium]|nr:Rid family detoxifying hydrolase [Ichthyobacteriaceae bacterium]
MKQIINSADAPTPLGPYNQAIKAGNLLFVSGQIAINPKTNNYTDTGIENETKLVMENIGAILKEANMTFCNVVKCSIFIKNMNQFNKINEVYGTYFTKNQPARETVEVSNLPKNVNIEISVIASE